MADDADVPTVVSASREIAASAERIFELIADPSQQPLWDGNDNLVKAEPGQRIRGSPRAAGSCVALGARAGGRRPHPGYPHLRLVAIDRSEPTPARSCY